VTDTALPSFASRLALSVLGTWHERTGGEFATNRGAGPDGRPMAGWVRMFGDRGSAGGGGDFAQRGAPYDYKQGGIQMGLDLLRRGGSERDIAGLYFASSGISGSVQPLTPDTKGGSASLSGYTLGGYYTHIGESGWYADAVLQGTRYTDMTADPIASALPHAGIKTRGTGVVGSIEGGYPVALNSEGLAFEPQAQLVFQRLSLRDAADSAAQISFGASNAVYGRLGGRLVKDWTRADGTKTSAWGRASVWSSFGAKADTTFTNLQGDNPTTLGTSLGGTWAQLDFGVSAQPGKDVTVFASGNYTRNLGQGSGHGWGARVGLKVAW
jgi:fibronectin-binding autotransporter adhesin